MKHHLYLFPLLLLRPHVLYAAASSDKPPHLPPCAQLCAPLQLCRSPKLLEEAHRCSMDTCVGASAKSISEWFKQLCNLLPEEERAPRVVWRPGAQEYNATRAEAASRLGTGGTGAVGFLTVLVVVIALLVVGGGVYAWVGWRNLMARAHDEGMERERKRRMREEREQWRREYRKSWGGAGIEVKVVVGERKLVVGDVEGIEGPDGDIED